MPKKSVRPIRIDNNIAFVPLTRGYEAIIDACDVPLVSTWNWGCLIQQTSRTVYAIRGDYSNNGVTTVWMHRVLMGSPKGFEIDHKDGNGLNNRRDNLRIATKFQNKQNVGVMANSVSGVKGVYFDKGRGKWLVQIMANGKRTNLGRFTNIEDAAAAYERAARELHGEFARLE